LLVHPGVSQRQIPEFRMVDRLPGSDWSKNVPAQVRRG
jgi:hypothetical protein